MKRHSLPSRTVSASAPKNGRVRLGAVKPAITTSWRFDVLIFSQLSVRAPDRYWLSARLAMMPSRPLQSASLKNFVPKVAHLRRQDQLHADRLGGVRGQRRAARLP